MKTAVDYAFEKLASQGLLITKDYKNLLAYKEAKEMEKEKHLNWNKFLESEKTLGISDVKTIERVQWYYNEYYNETFKSEMLEEQVMDAYKQGFRWFREKYNIHSFIIPLIDEVGFVYKYQARVHTEESAVKIIGEFETYEEAELACLEKLIEIVEQIKSE